jgi:hypothetical protein
MTTGKGEDASSPSPDEYRELLAEHGIAADAVHRPGDTKIGGLHNRDWLRRAYFDEKKTVKQIAHERKCSRSVVIDALNKIEGYKEEAERRRAASGAGGPRKLTIATVVAARRRHKTGELIATMAQELGVGDNTLYNAIFGNSWKEADSIEPPATAPHPPPHKLLEPDVIRWMAKTHTVPEIAAELSADEGVIRNVLRIREGGNGVGKRIYGQTFDFINKDGRKFRGTIMDLIESDPKLKAVSERNGGRNPVYDVVGRTRQSKSRGQPPRKRRTSYMGWTLRDNLDNPDFAFGPRREDRAPATDHTIRSWTNVRDGRKFRGRTSDLVKFDPILQIRNRRSGLSAVITGTIPSCHGWTLEANLSKGTNFYTSRRSER